MHNESGQGPRPGGETLTAPSDTAFEVLWQVARDLRSATSPDDILRLVAQAIAQAGLYRRAVLTLHNEQGDITAIGYHGIPDEVIAAARHARRLQLDTRQAILNSANEISESYFIPSELGLDLSREGRYVKSDTPPLSGGQWQSDDQLFVPLCDAGGKTIGYASVDTPPDGKRPDLPTIRRLEMFIHLATEALERARLDATESRLHRMITHTDDVILRANITDSVLDYVNPAIEKLTGYSVEYVMSRPLEALIGQFIYADDRSKIMAVRGQSRSSSSEGTRTFSTEFRVRHKNGDLRWVWEQSIGICDDDGRLVAVEGILRDITKRHELREKLAASEQKYRLLAENTRDLVYARDTEGNIFYVSPSAKQFMGVEPEEVVNTHFSDWLTDNPINRAAFEVFNAEVRRGETVPPCVLEVRSKAGRTFLMEFNESLMLEENWKVLGVQGVGRDITERKRAEEALKKSEQRFRELADLLPQTVFEIDVEGKLAFANRYGLQSFSYTRKDVDQGVNVMQLFLPQDTEKIKQNMQRLLQGGTPEGHEYTAVRKDGSTFPVLIYSSLIIHNDTPVGFRGIVFDLTERMRAEEKISESEEKWRSLVEHAPNIIMIVDRDGTIQFINHTVPGFSVEQTLGKNICDYTEPEYHDVQMAIIQEVFQTGKTGSYEVRGVGANGHDAWYETKVGPIKRNGQVVAVTLICTDITERKKALEAMRTSEETARVLMNATTESACLIDPQGTILAVNEGTARGLGKSIDELIGANVLDLFPPGLAEARKARVDEVVRSAKPVRFEDEREGRILDNHIYPVFDAQGNVERLAVFVRDITEQEKILHQLRCQSTELDRANSCLVEIVEELHRKNRRAGELTARYQAKNAELESMVSMLAHDLKAPLVSIRELTGIFRRRYSRLIDEGGRTLARRISSNAMNMLRLVESLLDYARAEDYTGSLEDLDLGRMVDDIWEQVIDAFPGRKAVLHRSSPPDSCRFSRVALARVLVNLLRNAVAYVPKERTPTVEVNWQRTDTQLTMSVADNGSGIPRDERKKIFELFYRAQPAATEGSGVGLAVVKKIVDAIGGTITVSARPGGGTVFTLELPLKAGSRSPAE